MKTNSKVLALKYRPVLFQDIIGDKIISEAISNAIKVAGKCVRDDVCGQIESYITELEGKAGLEYERLSQEL